jgi:hypothetical protein
MVKKKVVKQKKRADDVQLIADGSNKVLLVFPKGSKLKGKRRLSAAQVAKILKVKSGGADVQGQCPHCYRQCIQDETVM